jgi:hypothetical protein
MADETFEAYITKERTRIQGEKDKLLTAKEELDIKLAALDLELAAVRAYEEVKMGRSAPKATRAATGSGRRTGQRDTVLKVIKDAASGITAADVITKLSPADDADKTSIRNALAALKRNGRVDIKDGLYIAK